MNIKTCSTALASLLVVGCTSPQYDFATSIAPRCAGYRLVDECAWFARDFSARLQKNGIEARLVHFQWHYHWQTAAHVGVFYRADDGWWYQDNFIGPVLVDSFSRLSWDERLENALRNQGETGQLPPIEQLPVQIDYVFVE